MPTTYDTAVIGAGVFGAWTAWHLRRAGQRVLLVDQYGPASARASSGGETRVIRMGYGADAVYTRMARESLVAWKEFFTHVAQPELFRATGVLWLAAPGDARAVASLEVLAAYGIAHEVLQADELARRYPQIATPPGSWALFEPDSGALLARRAVQAVVAACVHDGVALRIDQVLPPVAGARLELRTRSGEAIHAGDVVFACGPWLGRVLPDPLGGRIFPTRQEVFHFGAAPGDTRFAAPALPVWLDFGRDYYGLPDLDGRGFKLAHDAHGEIVDPDTQDRAPTAARIDHARAFLAQRFPALADAPMLGAEVCQYENTSSGDFVLDRHPAFANAWIAGGGSGHGFKHGPAVGAYMAGRMLGTIDAQPRFALAGKQSLQQREVH